jgi:ABC-2 type transport system ATP-binding protein
MRDDVAIRVNGVSKTFKLPHEKNSSIKGALINLARYKRGYEKQQVLNNISFEIKKGEFFGIVGRNGSGKSTLLKLLAGIYTPDVGSIEVNGKLTPFIELGVGFNPELTGRENVFLNGALLGFNRKEMLAMYDEIVEFAELERFMDQKLKNYSSGMQVRLAFSIAVKARSDVVLLDEVLAVGDAAFQRKCFDYFMKLKKEKRTVILVTHDMGAVRQYCDKGIMIEKGNIVKAGKVETIAQAYQKLFNDEIAAMEKRGTSGDDERWGTKKMYATSVETKVTDASIQVLATYRASQQLDAPVLGFNIYNSRGMNLLEGNTLREKIITKPLKEGDEFTIEWKFPNVLAMDTYFVSVSCCNQGITEFYDWFNNSDCFIISKVGNTAGIVDPPLEAKLKANGKAR